MTALDSTLTIAIAAAALLGLAVLLQLGSAILLSHIARLAANLVVATGAKFCVRESRLGGLLARSRSFLRQELNISDRWAEGLLLQIVAGFLLFFTQYTEAEKPSRPLSTVTVEIHQLRAAITQFSVQYGMEPPSGITLHEHFEGWKDDPRSRRIVTRLWPQYDFHQAIDVNRDSDSDDSIVLTGAECLVFFLGGVIDRDTGMPQGFSKNPHTPFEMDDARRDGPFFEFGRMPSGDTHGQDILQSARTVDVDNDKMPEFLPPFQNVTTPYLYLSGYDGQGYRPGDRCVFREGDERNLRSEYLKYYDDDRTLRYPYNLDSYQLICAGPDDMYGVGGHYDSSGEDMLVGERECERDNNTNFSVGCLGD